MDLYSVSMAITFAVTLAMWWDWKKQCTDLDMTKLFKQLDKNHDGVLVLEEFVKLNDLGNLTFYGGLWSNYIHDESPALNETIVVRSLFTPLLIETMDKDIGYATIAMKGLFDWKMPVKHNTTIPLSDMVMLRPPVGTRVGELWYMVEPLLTEEDNDQTPDLSMRYYEPAPKGPSSAYTIYNLLSMFHQNVFIQTRFGPRGTIATLRAESSELLDIVFRCHGEFQLNSPPLLPFWFTPAQFQGRLIIYKYSRTVLNFSMTVPTTKHLNVDMEWMNKVDENLEVNIGFIPLMKLELADGSRDLPQVTWDQELELEEAYDLLGKKMLPFKQVPYYPVMQAVDLALKQQLLLHCVVLWGALDDQSC